MRGRPRPIAGLSLVLAALLTLTTAARGMSVQTTGGITYFTCTTTLPVCEWIEIGPVTRSGFNLTLTMSQKDGGNCVLCIDCYHTDTGAPFHLDVEQLGLAEHQFYRVRVLSDGISVPAPPP